MTMPLLVVVRPTPDHYAPITAPMISSEAAKLQPGERAYPRANLTPEDVPSAFRLLTTYPRRLRLFRWRAVAAVAAVLFGAFAGGAALVMGRPLEECCAVGSFAAFGILIMLIGRQS